MKKRRLTVTITRVRRQQTTTAAVPVPLRARCPVCGHEVELLMKGHAVGMLEVDEQGLDRLIAAGRVHVVETVSGSLWVCKDSLFSK